MKRNFISRFRLIEIALICLLILCTLSLTACLGRETEPPITTAPDPDPGFSLMGSGTTRVEDKGNGSFYLYVDENTSLDLKTIAGGKKSFTVTNSSGTLVENNVISVTKNGESYTVYYGDDKVLYRITVFFNEYVLLTFEGISSPLKVLKGSKADIIDARPEKPGYQFDGWDFDFNTVVTENVTIAAKWKPETYTVTFDTKGGKLSSTTMSVTYGDNVTLPVPTMEGYVFTGWHDGKSIVNSGVWTVIGDITLSAMWDHHDYKITYDPNGGEVEKTLQGVSFGDPFTMPTPKRAGYTFLGWFCDNVLVDSTSYPYREDKTFLAKWEENVYNVTFESNGGSSVEGGEYLYSQMEELIPVRDGYTFGGWFFDTGLTQKDADISSSNAVTAYAWWVEEDKPSSYRYDFTDKGAVILGYLSDATVCRLPSYIGGKPIVEIGERAFSETNIVSISFPNTVTKLGAYAFYGCDALEKINPIETETESVNIVLSGITSIGAYAFSGCTFTEINLPDSLKVLSDGVFADCKNLASVQASSVTNVGKAVFKGCTALTSIAFNDAVTSLGEELFSGCTALVNVTLPSALTTVGKGAFENCTALVTLSLPSKVTTIGDKAFAGCASLKTIANYLTSTKIVSIGSYAFSDCEALTTVGIPSSVRTLGAYAFENCLKLESITLPSNITVVADGVFKGCSYLTRITVSSPLTKIGNASFYGCRRLTTISLSDALLSIGESAFENCMALSDITLGSKLSYLGDFAFKGCTRLASVAISNAITVIPEGVFDGCLALSEVQWHNGITEIKPRAFADCQALSLDSFPTSCSVIGEEAFIGCRAIQSLSINQVLTYIGPRAFKDCISLSKISFSGTNERWKGATCEDSFAGCNDLKTVETITWTYDDLRPWIMVNPMTNALWAMDKSLSFNNQRPCAVIQFKPNNVFYKNLISQAESGAIVNSEYVWKLEVEGATEMISSFKTTIVPSLFDVIDIDGYGFVRIDLGEGIAALQGLKSCTLTLSIFAKEDESKLLYSASLGKIEVSEKKGELVPDADRTDIEKVTVSTTTEGANSLFDGDLTSVYFVTDPDVIYFKSETAFTLSSYSMITTASQSAYPTTVPKSFAVYGGITLKDGTVEWVEISYVENSWITADDLTEFNFKALPDRAYQQYKIEFDQSGAISLCELVLYKK